MTARPRVSRELRCILAGLVLCTGCGAASDPATTSATTTATAPLPDTVVLTDAARANAGIAVEPARTVTRAGRLTAPGVLALDEGRTARIGSLQEALILDIRAQVGDRLQPRQLLATMHGHALHDAWAGYRKAIAERVRAEHQLEYTTTAHARATRLYNDKAVSLQDVQRADVDRVTAAQELEIARAEVLRSIEELEHVGVNATESGGEPIQAEDSAEQIPVRTPIGGVVLERLVTPGSTVTPGTPLFVVSDLSRLWVIAEIDESQIGAVRTGRTVDVEVAAYPGERFIGTVTFIADAVNPATRRVLVRSTVANPGGRLKSDMFATVTLAEGEQRSVVVVPADAVQSVGGRSVVFVEAQPGRFVARQVELGPQGDRDVEVTSGLAEGDRVVVAGSFVLKSELLGAAGEGN